MTAQHDVEGLAVKLTEAEKTWLLANEDTPDTPLPPGIADVDWCEGDAIWNAMAELGLSEFWTTRLTPLGLRLRSHLIGTGNG